MTPKELSTSPERVRAVFEYSPETGVLRYKNPKSYAVHRDQAGWLDKQGYREVRMDGKRFFAHRVVWAYVYGAWPVHEIDHINGDRSDNRISNLRDVSRWGNQRNMVQHREGHLAGTTHRTLNSWQAKIQVNGVRHHIGSFATEQEAHEAYIRKSQEMGVSA